MEEELVIRVYPDYGNLCSLWVSAELVLHEGEHFMPMPWQLGIGEPLNSRILEWTEQFHTFYIEAHDGFDRRPCWEDGFDPEAWHREGAEIVAELEKLFPEVEILSHFDGYVFSANERRSAKGLLPLTLPDADKPGHITPQELRNRPDQQFS